MSLVHKPIASVLRNRGTLLVCVTLALCACTKEERDDSPTGPQPVGTPLPTTMISCGYVQDGDDTLAIVAPAHLQCDSSGSDTLLPELAVRSWFSVSPDTFKVALKNVSPVIRRIMSSPAFSSEITEFLGLLDTFDLGGLLLAGVFVRLEGDSGLVGLWRFAGLEPSILEQILTDEQTVALNDMRIDLDGRASMMFDIRQDSLVGVLSRRTYGEMVLSGAVDTALYDVTPSFVSDSTWEIAGTVSSDVVEMVATSDGDLYWTMGDSAHTYYQLPTVCPNPPMPMWFGDFLSSNPR